jgi:Amt family ammonium transporter
MLGLVSGVVAGLVAITPACGFVGVMGALVLGLIVSPVCFLFVSAIKGALGYDDSLDVFGVHCVGGIIGALATGICRPRASFGGVKGYSDYVACRPDSWIADPKPSSVTMVWSGHGEPPVLSSSSPVRHGSLVCASMPRRKSVEGLDLTVTW